MVWRCFSAAAPGPRSTRTGVAVPTAVGLTTARMRRRRVQMGLQNGIPFRSLDVPPPGAPLHLDGEHVLGSDRDAVDVEAVPQDRVEQLEAVTSNAFEVVVGVFLGDRAHPTVP